MESPRYPIGIQNFAELIESGYTYVDKTEYIESLVSNGKYYFLSRPRRFGKSLFLSTLHAYFEGRRELFHGLKIDHDDIDWTPSPVLHFDLNSEDFSREDGLEILLDRILRKYEVQYGVSYIEKTPAGRLSSLIDAAYRYTGRQVVILVDEYDKPLLNPEENPELVERNQSTLKAFLGNLKSKDEYIRFAFLTGVARFKKVSIFSDLNNLNDISLDNKYADICGWTEKELVHYFSNGINELAQKRNEGFEETLHVLCEYYDGYLFAEEGSRLYNPFSVLLALSKRKISPYWFSTGTPSFLARRVRNSGIELTELDGQYLSESQLISVGLDTKNPVGLMFQTGYLTIGSYDTIRNRYCLRFPNREVEYGFAEELYPLYIPAGERTGTPWDIERFRDNLYDGIPEEFMNRLQTLLKNLPFELLNESNYHSIVWLLTTLSGSVTSAESHSYRGRSDLEVGTSDYLYIFEFKYNRSVSEAVQQLHERDYAGRHAFDTRKIILIAANLSISSDQPLLTWHIEEAKHNQVR